MSAHMICRWVAPDDVADFERRGWVRSQARGHHEHYAIFMSTQEKVEMTTAATICTRATKLVDGERSRTHGAKEHNFRAIADIWSAYLQNRRHPRDRLEPSDAANLMELMKIARRLHGEMNLDDYVDGAGYAGCAGELADAENKRYIEWLASRDAGAKP